jgi:hypothetical protein
MSEIFPVVGAHIRLSANLLLRFGTALSAIWMADADLSEYRAMNA